MNRNTKPDGNTPKISVSNNQLALILTCWAVFTQMRDMISSWTLRQARQDATEVRAKDLEVAVAVLTKDSKTLSETIYAMKADIEKVRGEIKAEVNRSYEADQGFKAALDLLSKPKAP